MKYFINNLFSFALVSLSIICLQSNEVESAKILGLFPTQAKSHYIVGQRLLMELAKSGHELTVITQFKTKNLPPNYKEIHLDFGDRMDEFAKHLFDQTDDNQLTGGHIKDFFTQFAEENREILLHPKMQELLKSNEKFDLMIFEIFADEALLGLAQHFNIPVVGISTIGVSRWVTEYTASPFPYSYIPHFVMNFPEKMTFTQRFINTFMHLTEEYMLRSILYPRMEEIYNEIYPNPKPNFYDMLHTKMSLVLLNSHLSLGGTKPVMTNMIEVGGMHVDTKIKPLPKDMQDFIDSAEHGVIYFCLGSNVRPKYMHKEKKEAFVKALSSMKEKIIWKFDDDTMPVDKNKFYIAKWMPQNDILANPKVKLFITHGGLLGTTEAVVHGVPLVGIPIMADQKMNMGKAVLAGYGVQVDYTNVTESSLNWALNEVLNNPKYKNTMKELSIRFKDRPMEAIDTAKYWVEYVIRHKGAEFLQSPALQYNTIEYYNLDVYGIMLFAVQLVLYVCYRIIKKLVCCIFCRGANDTKKTDKKSKSKKD